MCACSSLREIGHPCSCCSLPEPGTFWTVGSPQNLSPGLFGGPKTSPTAQAPVQVLFLGVHCHLGTPSAFSCWLLEIWDNPRALLRFWQHLNCCCDRAAMAPVRSSMDSCPFAFYRALSWVPCASPVPTLSNLPIFLLSCMLVINPATLNESTELPAALEVTRGTA